MATGPVIGTEVFTPAREWEGKGSHTNVPYKKNRVDQQQEREANLLTMSLKYKLQEARTFWWTSNSLPSTTIFRSVNSFSLRCWFSSFNISVEQRKKTDNAKYCFRNTCFIINRRHRSNRELKKSGNSQHISKISTREKEKNVQHIRQSVYITNK